MAMVGKVRSMHFRQGKSISEIAWLTSLSRNTIKRWLKALQGAEPKCRRREMPTNLAPFEMAPLARQDPFRSFDVLRGFGLMAPKATPQAIVERMQTERSDAIQRPALAAQPTSQGLTSAFLPPAGAFGEFIAGERATSGRLIKAGNITAG